MRRLAVFFSLALAAAACGGTGGSNQATTSPSRVSSAQQAVLSAGSKTQGAKSARISFSSDITGGAASGTIKGDGAYSGRRGRMTMDLSGLGSAGALSGRMEVVFDSFVFYMKFPPALAQGLPGGKTWVKFDLAKLGKQQGVDFAQLMQLAGTDPTQSLDLLRAASTDFVEVGAEDVRGVRTTHYRGTIDLEKVAQLAPAKARESYRRIIELSGQSKVPMEVWIDDQGLTRRLRFEQKMTGGASMKMTEDLYDFGANVDVQLPAADQVLDITELIGAN
ncbi:MAG TPA: LppX_LprAFG lipoprotein [Gaiellaceae bacterium]|jgi:hypothetical protein